MIQKTQSCWKSLEIRLLRDRMELIRSILLCTSAVVIAVAMPTNSTDWSNNTVCDQNFEKCMVERTYAKVKSEVEGLKSQSEKLALALNAQKKQLDALQNRKEFKCESGDVGAYGWPDMPAWPATKSVKFQTAFEQAPTVTYGLYLLDQDKTYNLRVKAEVSNVSTTGFDMKVTQWLGSKLYGARATWMACGTVSPSL